jgi:AcrR family transcriptional regulator
MSEAWPVISDDKGTVDQSETCVPTVSRRARRRRETIEEILDLSVAVMKQEGLERLSLTAIAKRLGVQPTTLYKYFPSLVAVYDALFRRAVDSLSQEFYAAIRDADPGIPTIELAVRRATAWATQNPELAQLLIWRPIPGYTAPPDALQPAAAVLDLLAQALADAASAGEISSDVGGMRGAHIISVLLTGAACVYFTDSGTPWAANDFVEFVPGLIDMFVSAFSPTTK